MATSESKRTVFLSFEREQSVTEFAIKLTSDLEEQGFSIWSDTEEQIPTESLADRDVLPHNDAHQNMTKEKALEICRGLVVLLTKGYISSRYCEDEFFIAIDKQKRIFPVICEDDWDCVPESSRVMYAVSRVHMEWAMFRPGRDDYNISLAMLVKNMKLPLPDERPTLPQLQLLEASNGVKLRLIENAASKWKKVAIALRFQGPKIKTIEQGSHFQPEDCCLEMFMKWLDGGDNLYTPISWGSLAQCLKDAGLSILAADLESLLGLEYDSCLSNEETDNPDVDDHCLEQVTEEIDKLTAQFTGLVKLLFCEVNEIKTRTSLEEFPLFLTSSLPWQIRKEHTKYLKENLSYMMKAESLKEIFYHFNLYWNFIDYSLLKYIIDSFGSPQLKEKMTQYVTELRKFRKQTTLYQMIQCWDCESVEPPAQFSKLTTKLANRNAKEYTLEEVETLRSKFCREFSLSKCFMMLRFGLEGSVIIVWMMPSVLVSGLANAIQSNARSIAFFGETNIVEVTADGYILFSNQRPNLLKEYSEEVITGMSMEHILDQIQSKVPTQPSFDSATKVTHLSSVDESVEWVLHIRTLTGKVIDVSCSENDTIAEVKYAIKKVEGIPTSNQQLIILRERLEPPSLTGVKAENELLSREDLEPPSSEANEGVDIKEVELGDGGEDDTSVIVKETIRVPNQQIPVLECPEPSLLEVKGVMETELVEGDTPAEVILNKIDNTIGNIQFNTIILEDACPLKLYGICNGQELILKTERSQYPQSDSITTIDRVNIRMVSGSILTVPVDKHMSIDTLKERIQEIAQLSKETEELNAPDIALRLIYRGEELRGPQTMKQCGIPHGATIHLVSMKRKNEVIQILTPTGQMLRVDCDVGDTIADLKMRIEEEESIPFEQQNLIFLGRVIEDDGKTLSENNIHFGDTVHLTYKHAEESSQPQSLPTDVESEPIFVKTLTGRILHLKDCSVSDTIASIKLKIQAEDSITPEQQRLVFDGIVLDDDKTLSDYSINLGDTLNLSYQRRATKSRSPPPSTQLTNVHVKGSYGDPVKVPVQCSDTIADVKAKVYRLRYDMGDPEKQELYFEGQRLANDRKLSEYNIQDGENLNLRLGKGKLREITVKSFTSASDNVTIAVTSSDTIADVKRKVCEQKNIEPDLQRILYAGCARDDSCSLRELNVQNQSILHLVVLEMPKITIKPLSGEDIILDFNPDSTISAVKLQIKQKTDIPTSGQTLVYSGQFLEQEQKTLSECGVSNGSTLYMYDDSNLESDSLLLIKIPSLQTTVTLDFNPEATVRNLKDELFEKDTRILLKNCSLVYNRVHLDDEFTVGCIPKEDRVLDLIVLDKERLSSVGPTIEEVD